MDQIYTGRNTRPAIVSNDDIWFSVYLNLRALNLQSVGVYPPLQRHSRVSIESDSLTKNDIYHIFTRLDSYQI